MNSKPLPQPGVFPVKWVPLWGLLVWMGFVSAQAGPAPIWQGTTSDWNTASNWSPSVVPTGGSNAAFGSTGLAAVTLSASVSLGSITYNSGVSLFSINTNSNNLELGGSGLSNAASQVLNVSGGSLDFLNTATADAVSIVDNGTVTFSGGGDGTHFSTADHSKITVNSFLEFNDYATAANASITIAQNGTANFEGHSTAGAATLVNDWSLFFDGDSAAGSASILNDSTGVIRFEQGASAGSASIFNNGGEVSFEGGAPATMASAEDSVITNGGIVNVEQNATLGSASVSNLDNLNGSLIVESGGSAGSAVIYNGLGDTTSFLNDSTAANSKITTAGTLDFQDTSTAASATILNSGTINFLGDSESLLATAGSASVSNSGQIIFAADSTAGNAAITNVSSSASTIFFSAGSTAGSATLVNGTGDGIQFFNNSTAGSAAVSNAGLIDFAGGAPTTNGGILGATAGNADFVNSGEMDFNNFSTTGSASVTNQGLLVWRDNASAGLATIENKDNAAATIYFEDDASAGSAQLVNGLNDFVTFGGTSTAGSATIVNNGEFVFGGEDAQDEASAGSASILNNGVLGFSNFSTASGATVDTSSGASVVFGAQSNGGTGRFIVENGGVFDSSFASGTVTVGSIEGAGSFDLGGNNLTTGTNNLSTTVSGLIADGGIDGGIDGSLTKTGTGNLTLTSANTYSGGTEITGGTLTAQNGQALGTGDVLLQSGNLATSGGPMFLNVGGNYTQTLDGFLHLTLYGSGSGQQDVLIVSGNAHLGGTLDLVSGGGYVPVLGQQFVVVDAGGVTGIFNGTQTFMDVRFLPFYTSTTVTLDTILGSFADLGPIHLTPNETAVAQALDAAFDDPHELSLMQTLGISSNSTLKKDYGLIDPSAMAAVFQMGFAAAQARAALVGQRLDELMGGTGLGWTTTALKYGTEAPLFAGNLSAGEEMRLSQKVSNERQDWQVFATGAGNFGTLAGDSNAAGYQFSTGGLTAGMDRSFGKDLIGGILLAYDQSGSTGTSATVKATGGSLGLYAGWKQKELHVEGLLEGGLDNYQTQLAGFGAAANGKTSGLEFSGQLGAGFDWTMDSAQVGPFVSGQYSLVQMNGFTETGSSAPLVIPSQAQSSFLSDLGVRAVRSFKIGGSFILTPSFSAAWEHIYSGSIDSLSANLGSSATAFTVQGPQTGSDGLAIGAGINAQFAPGVGAYAGVQGRLGFADYSSSSFEGGVNFGL